MKIKMTTLEVIERYQVIEKMISEQESLPIELAWNLEDNQEEFKKVVEKFEKHRDKIMSPMNEKGAFIDCGDGKLKVKEEFRDEFLKLNDEINKLLTIVNEIEIKTCKKELLPQQIKVNNLRAIKFMIKD